jgi:hypothetical protein
MLVSKELLRYRECADEEADDHPSSQSESSIFGARPFSWETRVAEGVLSGRGLRECVNCWYQYEFLTAIGLIGYEREHLHPAKIKLHPITQLPLQIRDFRMGHG